MSRLASNYLHKNLKLQVNLKSFCNLRCDYCALPEISKNYKGSEEQLVENTKKLIDKIKAENYNLQMFYAYGAEPTTVSPKVLAEVLLTVKEAFPELRDVGFQTNGTLFDKEYLEEFLSVFHYTQSLRIFWSIDGVKSLHDKHRCNSYDKATENLLYVAQNTDIRCRVTCTTNIEHFENEATEAEFIEWIKLLKNNHIELLMAAADMTINEVSDSHIGNVEFADKYADFIIKNNLIKDTGKLTSASFCYRDGNTCSKTLFDLQNGNVYLCEKGFDSQTVLANWFDTSIEEIMSVRCNATTDKPINKECFTCEYAMWCRGGCPIRRTDGGLSMSCNATKKILIHIKENINENWYEYLMMGRGQNG